MGTPTVDLSNNNPNAVTPPPTQPDMAPNLSPPGSQPPVPNLGGPGAGAADTPEQGKVPFWKTILTGALNGLAGSSGSKTFFGGAAQGVGSELKQEQVGKDRLENKKDQFSALTAQIKFRNYQDALNAANLSTHAAQLDQMQGATREAAQKAADEHANFLQTRMGIPMKPIAVGSAGPGPTINHLAQASVNGVAQGGAEVNPITVAGPDTMYVPDTNNETGPAKSFEFLKVAGSAFGLPVADRAQFMSASPAIQASQYTIAGRMLAGAKSDGKPYTKADEGQLNADITNMQSALAKVQQNPNSDPRAAEMIQTRLSHLTVAKAGLNQANDDATKRQIQVAKARGSAINDSKILTTTGADGTPTYDRAGNLVGKTANTNGALFMGTLPDGSQVAGAPDELKAAGANATAMTKISATDQGKILTSRQLVAPNGLFHNVAADIATLEQNGNIDAVGSHWKEFWAGKLNTDPQFQKLRTSMGLLDTALMQAHVGARGGSDMLAHFKHLADYSVSDGATLKAALSEEFKYAQEKAAFIPKKAAK